MKKIYYRDKKTGKYYYRYFDETIETKAMKERWVKIISFINEHDGKLFSEDLVVKSLENDKMSVKRDRFAFIEIKKEFDENFFKRNLDLVERIEKEIVRKREIYRKIEKFNWKSIETIEDIGFQVGLLFLTEKDEIVLVGDVNTFNGDCDDCKSNESYIKYSDDLIKWMDL